LFFVVDIPMIAAGDDHWQNIAGEIPEIKG
jgi:hypothetical protein